MTTTVATDIHRRIADELGVRERQVAVAVDLLDGGATVPFIARYRKEATGTLDDAQLRTLEDRLRYLRELEDRRAAILESIRAQGKLDEALEAQIMAADSKARLEDIYLPYKPRRRTKAQIAREAGLEPLAEALLADPTQDPQAAAAAFVDEEKGVADTGAALEGARAILVERFAEDADLIGTLRERMWSRGRVVSRVRDGRQEAGAKFADYFDFSEPFTTLPSHRILAMFRGEKEEVLDLTLDPQEDPVGDGTVTGIAAGVAEPGTGGAGAAGGHVPNGYESRIAERFAVRDAGRPADRWLVDTVRWAWRTRILVHLDIDLRMRLWQAAEDEAVRVFAANLRDLLLAAPAGTRSTMGLDPGFRTGVKVAVVDATGKVVATETIYPHQTSSTMGRNRPAPPAGVPADQHPGHRSASGPGPRERRAGPTPNLEAEPDGATRGAKRQPPAWEESIAVLARLARTHQVELIAIGNGTASRETDKFAADLIARHPELALTKVVVSEAGASVYSASAYAGQELPDLDVSLRGAVSIARRLQDPLAELVKIDPKSIGVGQYQHDVSELKLSRSLDAVVEDCVNAVGVDVNTASSPLLTRVSGIGAALAERIVAHRDANGPFRSRAALTDVPRLGPKAFEQCAGFLRIRGGDDPLDASSVHPEAYPVVHRILSATSSDIATLIGSSKVLRALRPADFVDDAFGLPTVTDILAELEKPGRDPRPAFETASFTEGVDSLTDLAAGMVLEGVVTNVAAFGAFVDVGVHQDGLVHVSAMAKTFVSNPRDIVKSGDVVRVKVLGVDIPRKRISLTLRLDDDADTGAGAAAGADAAGQRRRTPSGGERHGQNNTKRASADGTANRERTQRQGAERRQGADRGAQQQRRRGGGHGGPSGPDTALADALRRAGLGDGPDRGLGGGGRPGKPGKPGRSGRSDRSS